ncbi:hypothetical protein CUJ83_00730 [Methanocella sp. CWC-04]|uniref:ScoMcrA-like N-terminal head domain-containing protein n=1 Tax=Methanooceanicella nereidis TaxID=2052831 RepID=A0AAP2W3U7_9EURY|nr:hypothetical protein [Methanocella sp. CWC-04]MCD1293520.1 hypothetical protein [Methanocella sp. CWC-04]
MIPKNIIKENILESIKTIDKNGIPDDRRSKRYDLLFKGKKYPPKYIISLANVFANGKELDSCEFNGGKESNRFLIKLGFNIVHKEREYCEISIDGDLKKNYVVTIILKDNDNKDSKNLINKKRLKAATQILNCIDKEVNEDTIVLFPAGWVNTGRKSADIIYDTVEKYFTRILQKNKNNIVAVVGIDGKINSDNIQRDQIALAINKNGIIAIGRKFYPTKDENGVISIAKSFNCLECGKNRYFEFNGLKYFLCICYDSFGLKKLKINNPGMDVILNLVHRFHPAGEGNSGDVYFARHGFAGVSKQWKCKVYGSAIYFNRDIQETWPTGVYWNKGEMSTSKWKYQYNTIGSKKKILMDTIAGKVLLKIYEN